MRLVGPVRGHERDEIKIREAKSSDTEVLPVELPHLSYLGAPPGQSEDDK